jgi:uncharacterized membrane protein YgcG
MCKVALWHTRRITAQNQISNLQRQMNWRRRQTKAAWTAAVIIMIFVLLFLPSFVINCLQILNKDLCRMNYYQSIWAWVSFISYISSSINPWIYAIRSDEYRLAFKSIFKQNITGDSRFGSLFERSRIETPGVIKRQNTPSHHTQDEEKAEHETDKDINPS